MSGRIGKSRFSQSLSRKQFGFHFTMEEELKEMIRRLQPSQIEDVWRIQSEWRKFSSHILSEHLDWWFNEEEVSELLNDDDRLSKIAAEFKTKSRQLGMFGRHNHERLNYFNTIFVNPECDGCNNPYDMGGCRHPGSPERAPMFDPQVNQLAHDTLIMLSVINYLVAYEFSHKSTDNKLALLLTPNQNTWASHNVLETPQIPTISLVLGLMENCSHSFFPKVAHKAAGLLSLLICQSPAAAFSCIDGKAFIASIWNYLKEIFRLVHNNKCPTEQHYGVVAFLNILPALYHLGNWNEAKSSTLFNDFMGKFVTLTINICHGAVLAEDDDFGPYDLHLIRDPPRDWDKKPWLIWAQVLMEALLMVKEEESNDTSSYASLPSRDWRIKFVHTRPRTFAVMAALEILGWWISQGIDLSFTKVAWAGSSPRTIKSVILEYQPRIRLLIKGSPRPEESSRYLEPILDAIINTNSPRPKIRKASVSLLYGPFIHDNRRCGHCQKTADALGHDMLRCQGGCGGLQHYCSKEHQKEHWAEHKFFCKQNQKYCQYTGK